MRITRNVGMLLLGIWLILTGILGLGGSLLGILLAVLAIAAGVFILLGR